jgi:hypothetical protein
MEDSMHLVEQNSLVNYVPTYFYSLITCSVCDKYFLFDSSLHVTVGTKCQQNVYSHEKLNKNLQA